MRCAAVATGLGVMVERMSWGWHSLGQTSAGATLGILLYFWSTRVPLYFTVVETLVTLPLSVYLLLIDPARPEWGRPGVMLPNGNLNNLLAWLIWGWAFQLLACSLIVRHFCALGILTRMRSSFVSCMRALAHAQGHYAAGKARAVGHMEDAGWRGAPDESQSAPSESVSQVFSQ